jgi:hypothetical protein
LGTPDLMRQRNFRIRMAIGTAVLLVALYCYLYLAKPFAANVLDLATTGMIVLAALAAAILGVLVWFCYGAASPPRRVWSSYALALCGWVLAECIWMYEYTMGRADSIGPADVFWVVSYAFFAAAMYHQYVLIYRPPRRVGAAFLVFCILAMLIFTWLFAVWLAGTVGRGLDVDTLVPAFYAVGDFAIALAALLLAFSFRNGALGRPWLGLLFFAFSDFLYAWLDISGLYSWSVAQGNTLTLLTDALYFVAYLVVALGCYLQWLLLSYGPRLKI